VKPYVKRGKNDATDAEAICEAVTRPNMRFVPVKSADQKQRPAPAQLRRRRTEGPSANRSLSTVEPVCGTPKWKLENGAQRPAPETRPARTEIPKIAGQRLGRASLTRGNVPDSHPPGNNTPETRLPGPPHGGIKIRCLTPRRFFNPCLCTLLEVFFLRRQSLPADRAPATESQVI
jgi:hypothetical protein